jgi:hypothetical protein
MRPKVKPPGSNRLKLKSDKCFQFCFKFAFKFKLRRYVTEMPFGTVYYGDTMRQTCIVYNNGPMPVEFWVKGGTLNP